MGDDSCRGRERERERGREGERERERGGEREIEREGALVGVHLLPPREESLALLIHPPTEVI